MAKNHRNKSFAYYNQDDIEQEAWIIAIEKIQDFDISKAKSKNKLKALEHWLNTVISNRLANLYRDKLSVPQKNGNIITPSNIDGCQLYNEDFNLLLTEQKELWSYILNNLNVIEIDIIESLLSGEKIDSYYKNKLHNKIKKLIVEFNNG